MQDFRLLIDASNIRRGGGLTNLRKFLEHAVNVPSRIEKFIVLASPSTTEKIPDHEKIEFLPEPGVAGGPIASWKWHRLHFKRVLRESGASLIYYPGSSRLGGSQPYVTISQNMIPFEKAEMDRFPWNRRIRYHLLRRAHKKSFSNASGLLFLTDYARETIVPQLGRTSGEIDVVPNGVSLSMRQEPRPQRKLEDCSPDKPFRFLYVSTINCYKHQWHVIEAAGRLRKSGLPVQLDLVGTCWPGSMGRIEEAIEKWDPEGKVVKYHGEMPYDDMHMAYSEADAFVFASTCENMPIIMIEAMSAGLPIAATHKEPMLGILGDAGVTFEQENPESMAEQMRLLMEDPKLREKLAEKAFEKASSMTSWKDCAIKTVAFFEKIESGLTP